MDPDCLAHYNTSTTYIVSLGTPYVRLLHSTHVLCERPRPYPKEARMYHEEEVQFLLNRALARTEAQSSPVPPWKRPLWVIAGTAVTGIAIFQEVYLIKTGQDSGVQKGFIFGMETAGNLLTQENLGGVWWQCHDCGAMNEYTVDVTTPCKQCGSYAMVNLADRSEPHMRNVKKQRVVATCMEDGCLKVQVVSGVDATALDAAILEQSNRVKKD